MLCARPGPLGSNLGYFCRISRPAHTLAVACSHHITVSRAKPHRAPRVALQPKQRIPTGNQSHPYSYSVFTPTKGARLARRPSALELSNSTSLSSSKCPIAPRAATDHATASRRVFDILGLKNTFSLGKIDGPCRRGQDGHDESSHFACPQEIQDCTREGGASPQGIRGKRHKGVCGLPACRPSLASGC